MKVHDISIYDIKDYENNPRRISEEVVNAVASSIREFGFKQPIVIDKNNVIVCGHTRVRAAKKLGIEEIPCIIADDLTPEQIKAFRLADNKTSELSAWDFDKLDLELEELNLDFDMGEFGFEGEGIKQITANENKEISKDKGGTNRNITIEIMPNIEEGDLSYRWTESYLKINLPQSHADLNRPASTLLEKPDVVHPAQIPHFS